MGKRLISLLLAAAMLVCMLPAAAFAEGEEPGPIVPEPVAPEDNLSVIKTIKYNKTSYTPSESNSLTLEVPFSFKGTIGIDDLSINYDQETYGKYAFSAKLEKDLLIGAESEVTETNLIITYTDEETNLSGRSEYNISVNKAAKKDAAFSGSVQIYLGKGDDYSLSGIDFEKYYTQNDDTELDSLTINGGTAAYTVIKNGNAVIDTKAVGVKINKNSLRAYKLVAVDAGVSEYSVSALRSPINDADTELDVNGSVSLDVSVLDTMNLGTKDLGTIKSLSEKELAVELDKLPAGILADKVSFTLPATGSLYDVTANKKLTSSNSVDPSHTVKFVPDRSTNGNVEITYSVSIKNAEGIFYGKNTVKVEESTRLNAINYNDLKKGDKVVFDKGRFNSSVKTITFELPSSGSLKYDGIALGANQPIEIDKIDKLQFIPKSDFTGTVTLYYTTSIDTEPVYGTVNITYRETEVEIIKKTISVDDIYEIPKDEIKAKYKTLTNSSSYDYIKIDSVKNNRTANKGKLYYDYEADAKSNTEVTAGSTKYYYSPSSSQKGIADLKFVPNGTGTTTIDYTIYSSAVDNITGQIVITIEESEYDLGDVKYTGEFGKTITLKAADFQKVLTNAETTSSRRTLDYIEFDALPSSKYGVLYYNYDASKTTNSKVKTTTKLYYNDDDEIEIGDVTFVPANAYSGTFNIEYTAYNTKGNEYDGRIVVTVKDGGTELENITYTLESGKVFTFVPSDINTKFDKLTGENFDYIKFTLPSSSAGTLYYDYLSATNKGTAVRKSDSLYRAKVTGKDYDLLKNISFVPVSGFSGTVTISYTAYSSEIEDKTFTGKIVLTYKAAQSFSDVKSTDYFYKPVLWAVEQGITEGTSATKFSPANNCTRAQAVTFLWRAAGEPEPKSKTTAFTDVKSGDYYYKAVLWAVEQGITDGTSKTKFSPSAYCTRAQIVTFMWRFAGESKSSQSMSFSDVTATSYYVTAVKWALQKGITDGLSTTKFGPNNDCTRGQIVTFLYRYYN